jgi:hypothetical protein
MKTTAPAVDPSEITAATPPTTEPIEPAVATASADPVVAEDVGHPVGVGIGAFGAGAAGAAIGAVAGPVGMLVGAVIGAVAGGVIGEEVAAAGEDAVTDNPDGSYTAPDLLEPASLATGSTSFGDSEPASGSLFSGAGEDSRASVDTTPDIQVIPAVASTGGAPSEDAVRTSAYYHYLAREMAGREGDAVGDWIEAEREMQSA